MRPFGLELVRQAAGDPAERDRLATGDRAALDGQTAVLGRMEGVVAAWQGLDVPGDRVGGQPMGLLLGEVGVETAAGLDREEVLRVVRRYPRGQRGTRPRARPRGDRGTGPAPGPLSSPRWRMYASSVAPASRSSLKNGPNRSVPAGLIGDGPLGVGVEMTGPRVHAPEIQVVGRRGVAVVAVGAVVVDHREVLGGATRRMDGLVTGLDPDRGVRARDEALVADPGPSRRRCG